MDFSASHPSRAEAEEGAVGTQLGQLIQGTAHSTGLHAQCVKLGQKEEEDVQSDGICLPKPPPLMMDPDCPGMAELLPLGMMP